MTIKAKDLTADRIAEHRARKPASAVISDLFQTSNSNVRQNWKKNPGAPDDWDVDRWVDFRKMHEGVSRGSNDSSIETKELLDREKLRVEQIKGDKNELELAEQKRNLYRREGVERMMASMKDTIENLLLRMPGSLIVELDKVHSGKVPAKIQRAIRKAFPTVIEEFNDALAEEGAAMMKDIRKRKASA